MPLGVHEGIKRKVYYYGRYEEDCSVRCRNLFGSAGFKLLSSSDAKKVYTQTTAAVLRMKDSTMETVSKVQEQAGDILEDAKAINEARAAKAEAEVIEDAAEAETTETNE